MDKQELIVSQIHNKLQLFLRQTLSIFTVKILFLNIFDHSHHNHAQQKVSRFQIYTEVYFQSSILPVELN